MDEQRLPVAAPPSPSFCFRPCLEELKGGSEEK